MYYAANETQRSLCYFLALKSMEVTYGKREGKDRKKVRWTRRKNKGEMKTKKMGGR